MKNELKFKHQPHLLFKYLLAALLILAAPAFIQAQNKVITGIVSDENKLPIPGATITVKGTKTAVSTNSDGQYKIQASPTDQLVFSFVGFNSKTVSVGAKSSINISLESSTTGLEEVVVIGYGTVKKKDVTGSVSKVNIADMNKAPVASFDQALAGRVAGVQVTSSDGKPGGGIDIVIRGNNSVTQGNSPLYVIDGFLVENPDTNSINPAEIESMEILKDASATAIYGARGANGVIVITTKKGKAGGPVFTINSTTGIQAISYKVKTLSPYEYVKYQLEFNPSLAIGSNPRTPTEIYLFNPKLTLDAYKNSPSIDWFDLSTRTALYKNNDFSVRGGSKKFKYSLSGSHTNQEGIMLNSEFKRYQGRVVLDYQVTNKLKVGINTNYSDSRPNGINPTSGSNGVTTNLMTSVWGSRPIPDPKINLEEEFKDPDVNASASDYRVNPVITLKNTYNKNIQTSFYFNTYLEYLILKDLKLRSTYGYTENKGKNSVFYNDQTREAISTGPFGSIRQNVSTNWLNENTLTWDKKIGKSKLNVLGGFTVQRGKSWSYGQSASRVPSNSIDDLHLGVQNIVIPQSSNWSMASFLARVNYSYDSRYLFTASYRADGSSKFPAVNHWGYFPSGAFAWNFKEEKFLKKNKTLSEGKIRISYGQTGNNRVSDFGYLTTYNDYNGNTPYAYSFGNEYSGAFVPTGLGNSKLKWETTEQVDAGLDVGFFKQRIQLAADVYRKRTIDLLLNADLPPSSGFGRAFKNIGSVENKGLELTLTTKNIVTKDFTWTSSANIAFNRNKLLSLNEGQNELTTPLNYGGFVIGTYVARVGQPLGLMYGYEWLGTYKYSDFNTSVNPTTGATEYTLKPEIADNGKGRQPVSGTQPGDIKYRDQDGDGTVNAKDAVVIGKGTPKHIGGFSNNFTYKGFDLNVFFQWSYGNDIQNYNRQIFGGPQPGNAKNQYAEVANRWTPENPNSDLVRVGGAAGVQGQNSSFIIEDGSYIRLKTVSFGYNVNSDLVRQWHLKSLRFALSAQNLITWTKYSGSDPEVSWAGSVLTPGFDLSGYPRARTLNLVVNMSF